MKDASANASVRQRLTELGQKIPSHDQQTPEVLVAYQKAEADKGRQNLGNPPYLGSINNIDCRVLATVGTANGPLVSQTNERESRPMSALHAFAHAFVIWMPVIVMAP